MEGPAAKRYQLSEFIHWRPLTERNRHLDRDVPLVVSCRCFQVLEAVCWKLSNLHESVEF